MIEGWFAPNLTADPRSGLGSWSQDEVVQFLQTGRNRHTAAGGLMSGVVQGSVSKMDPDDVRAIATYLKSLPPSAPKPAVHVDAPAMARGQTVFAANCASCHAGEGQSADRVAPDLPPLQGSPHIQAQNPTTLIRYVLSGTRTAVTAAHPQPAVMPGFAAELDDRQTADVLSYIRNAWGDSASAVSAGQVASIRAATVKPQAGG